MGRYRLPYLALQTVSEQAWPKCHHVGARNRERHGKNQKGVNLKAQSKNWPKPREIEIAELMPVPKFPDNFLSGAFGRFAKDVSERMDVDLAFTAIPLLIATATALGNSVKLQLKANDTRWRARPVLWGGIIGYSGGRKSPAAVEVI